MPRIKEVQPIDPGKMNKKLLILRRTLKGGSQGQPKDDWDEVGNFWAHIETLGGTELERLSRKFATCSHRIHANYAPKFDDLHPVDRLKYGEKIFDISHVENVDFANVRIEIVVSQIKTRPKSK